MKSQTKSSKTISIDNSNSENGIIIEIDSNKKKDIKINNKDIDSIFAQRTKEEKYFKSLNDLTTTKEYETRMNEIDKEHEEVIKKCEQTKKTEFDYKGQNYNIKDEKNEFTKNINGNGNGNDNGILCNNHNKTSNHNSKNENSNSKSLESKELEIKMDSNDNIKVTGSSQNISQRILDSGSKSLSNSLLKSQLYYIAL